jgi:Tol biopolymer transport system component
MPIAAVMFASLLAGLGVACSSTSDTVADTSVAATPDTVAETTSASPPLTGRILFTRAGGEFGDETVFMVNADGTNERRLTEPGDACCPRLSPDGSQLMLMPEDQEPDEPLSGVIMTIDDGA